MKRGPEKEHTKPSKKSQGDKTRSLKSELWDELFLVERNEVFQDVLYNLAENAANMVKARQPIFPFFDHKDGTGKTRVGMEFSNWLKTFAQEYPNDERIRALGGVEKVIDHSFIYINLKSFALDKSSQDEGWWPLLSKEMNSCSNGKLPREKNQYAFLKKVDSQDQLYIVFWDEVGSLEDLISEGGSKTGDPRRDVYLRFAQLLSPLFQKVPMFFAGKGTPFQAVQRPFMGPAQFQRISLPCLTKQGILAILQNTHIHGTGKWSGKTILTILLALVGGTQDTLIHFLDQNTAGVPRILDEFVRHCILHNFNNLEKAALCFSPSLPQIASSSQGVCFQPQ